VTVCGLFFKWKRIGAGFLLFVHIYEFRAMFGGGGSQVNCSKPSMHDKYLVTFIT
jgi:hypothetical protein